MVGHRPTIALPDKQGSSKPHTSVHIINMILAHTRSLTLCTRERRRWVWRLRREGLPQGGAERGERSCCHVKTTVSEQTIESGQSSPRQRYMLLVYSDPELSWYRFHYYTGQSYRYYCFLVDAIIAMLPAFLRAPARPHPHIIRLWVDPFNSIDIRAFLWRHLTWRPFHGCHVGVLQCTALIGRKLSTFTVAIGSYLFIVSISWTGSYLHYNTQTVVS